MKQQTLHTMNRDQVAAIARAHNVQFEDGNSSMAIIRKIEATTGRQGNENWASGNPAPWLNEDGTEAPRY